MPRPQTNPRDRQLGGARALGPHTRGPYAEVPSSAPDVQHALAKAADELIGYIRWENFAEIIERAAHHDGKFMCGSMLCPSAPQLQTALPICRCIHRPGLSPRSSARAKLMAALGRGAPQTSRTQCLASAPCANAFLESMLIFGKASNNSEAATRSAAFPA